LGLPSAPCSACPSRRAAISPTPGTHASYPSRLRAPAPPPPPDQPQAALDMIKRFIRGKPFPSTAAESEAEAEDGDA
jgi:hypothetical protein